MKRFIAITTGLLLLSMSLMGCGPKEESSTTIIGGADGPTAIYLTPQTD